ncbi:MAG: hypothetical protein NC254_13565 [bacterium]|nr:hypothetical protein [bacterium]
MAFLSGYKISPRLKGIGLAGMLACAVFLSGCAGVPESGTGESAAGAPRSSYDADAQADGGYYYETLTDDGQRTIYMQMLQSMRQMGQEELLDCQDADLLYRIFCAVLADHPELFYVTGYTNTEVLQGGEILHMLFSASYSMSEAEAAQCQSRIDDFVTACLSCLPEGDDYARIRYLYEYVICNTEYDLEAPENQNICSVFLYGRSVCQGYAKAFQYLCREAGIEAALVTGRIRESGYRHAWNLVRSNGAYYYVDATWGDASYTMEGAAAAGMPDVNYEYLCVTTEQIERTHEIDLSVAGMPYCTATEDNYYVREHALFTAFDERALDLFLTDRPGTAYVTFRCETADVYSAYHDYLIGQEHIFDYMDSPAGVSYSDNEDTLTFGFWLPQNG